MTFSKFCSLSILAPILLLVGCGGENSAAPAPEQETTSESAPAPAASSVVHVVVMGITPPFSFQDEKGQLSGIDIDVLKAIAESEGLSVQFHSERHSEAFADLDSGERQAVIGGINYTEERNSKYGLSQSYFYNPSAIMYKNELMTKPKSLEELSGMQIAVVAGTKQLEQAKAISGAKTKSYPTPYATYKAVLLGEADVTLQDLAPLQHSLEQEANLKGLVTVVPYEHESDKTTETVIAVKKENQELLNKINAGITKLKANGKLDEIKKKYQDVK